MPSVRVRRGSQYASLVGDEGQGEQPAVTRPRSRTLASIYRPPSIANDLEKGDNNPGPLSRASRSGSGSGSGEEGEKAGPSHSVAVEDVRPTNSQMQGRVADHILTHSRSSRALQTHTSRDYLRSDHGRLRSTSGSPGPGRVTLEGSQVDFNVPRDAGPGLLESNLSLNSGNGNPFRSDEDSLHHDDDIVEYVLHPDAECILPLMRFCQTSRCDRCCALRPFSSGGKS